MLRGLPGDPAGLKSRGDSSPPPSLPPSSWGASQRFYYSPPGLLTSCSRLPPTGGNTCGPAKPDPRCFTNKKPRIAGLFCLCAGRSGLGVGEAGAQHELVVEAGEVAVVAAPIDVGKAVADP